MTAQVKRYHGTPTIFINGKPCFYGLMWGSPPTPKDYALNDCASSFAEAGIHLFTFDMGTGGKIADWCGPKPGMQGHIDFSTLEKRFQYVINADPGALFHLRIHLEMPEWWQALYPQECELVSDGRRLCQSFASKVWHTQAKDFLNKLVNHIKMIGLSERVIAYQCCTGSSGEWVKGPGAMGLVCGDYSQPMQEHFQNWIKRNYHQDEYALRSAWNNPGVTFRTVAVPPPEAQFKTTQYTFRDPKRERQVIDYYHCLSDLCADLLIDFCTTVKEATERTTLAGAFYGYLLELAWNAGFFGEGVDSEYSTYQRSGHLGLAKVLESPNVDFLVSPYSYGFRGIGGEGCAMLPTESLRLYKKFYIFEDDTRTHLSLHDHPNYGKTDTLEDNIAVLKRNFAYVVTHGMGIWWLAGGGPQTPHIDLSQQPAFIPLIERFQKIGKFSLTLENSPGSEVAVLLDDESFYYEWLKNNLDLPLIFQQRLWGLPHMGAPFDVYLLNDFITGKIKPYKLYIFLNAFQLDNSRREALKKEICKDGHVALWIYAPGLISEDISITNMTDLTGITFGSGDHPWGPMVNPIDFNHPITNGLPYDMFWGTNNLLGPVFHVADPVAKVLGNVVYSQGRCLPGFVIKEFPEWVSIYSAAPNLPSAVLRGVASFAGVHIYSQDGDVLYATKNMLAIHTASGGKRILKLPGMVERVYDLYLNNVVAVNTQQFEVILPPASTALFYTGKIRQLEHYLRESSNFSP